MEKVLQEKIAKLQTMEQSVQQYVMQRQQFNAQLLEIDSALSEIESSQEMYKIIGNIMVKSSKATLKKELEHRKEMANLRIKTLEKQEGKIKDKGIVRQVKMEEFKSIIEALNELQNESGVPRNVKSGIAETIITLKEDDTEPSIKINKALNRLEEIAEDTNMQPYTRTQLFNVVTLLEMI